MPVDSRLVLVVEDDMASSHALVKLLESLQYSVLVAITLAEGLRHLVAASPSVVVLDLLLPDGNGIEMLRAIRRERRPIKVAVISGASDEMLSEASHLEPEAIFGKPLDVRDFREWLTQKHVHSTRASSERLN